MPRFAAALLAALCLATAAAAQPARWAAEWPRTDFSQTSVDLETIFSGGPPRDGIPSIDDPRFIMAEDAGDLSYREAVLTVELPGETPRAYPIRYMIWHEIVNDVIGTTPVAVTYCPLCNSAMVFDRRVGGQVLDFGVSGNLRHSDMIMYDRQTESWWQQATAEGIVGEMTGVELTALPAWMESYGTFLQRHPQGLVLAEPTEWRRAYGRNPYRAYDSAERPFLYDGEDPPHGIPPLARVVRVGDRAWPLDRLVSAGRIEEAGLSLAWAAGVASPLDTSDITQGRETGMVRVRDASGADVVHDVLFAFAFHAFWPEGEWMLR